LRRYHHGLLHYFLGPHLDMSLIVDDQNKERAHYQAALYDCAVIKPYQGRGLGKLIVQAMLSKLSGCNIILYASPGKEGFYKKLGFRKMKTGMAYFMNRDNMAERGFTE
jgi:ribosomal protein S18 acetylase RimI-like enzyme